MNFFELLVIIAFIGVVSLGLLVVSNGLLVVSKLVKLTCTLCLQTFKPLSVIANRLTTGALTCISRRSKFALRIIKMLISRSRTSKSEVPVPDFHSEFTRQQPDWATYEIPTVFRTLSSRSVTL